MPHNDQNSATKAGVHRPRLSAFVTIFGLFFVVGTCWAGWKTKTSPTTNSLYAVHFPVDATVGYAVGAIGTILKTTDDGVTWSAQTSGTGNNLLAVQFPVDATTGYATGDNGTILKTIDGGAIWTSQSSGTINHLRSVDFPVDATTGYVTGANGTILTTTDGGVTWTSQSSGTPSALWGVDFPVDATTGYSVGDRGTILKRTSGGFSTFTWLANAIDVSLTTTGRWQDIALETYLPAGATGAVIELSNSGTQSKKGVLRGKEDTRNYWSGNINLNLITPSRHQYQIVKVDADRLIQGRINNVDMKFRLLGYTTGADPSYFATPPDITPGAGGWTTVDVSALVDADADGVILFIQHQANNVASYGMREFGSTDNTLSIGNWENRMHLVGLDAAKRFKANLQNNKIQVYLVGQTKGSVVYYTNNAALPDPPLNSWQARDADDYAVAPEANGLFFSVWNGNEESLNDIGFRHGDSTDDWDHRKLDGWQGLQAATGINDAIVWDQYQGANGIDVSIAAYTTELNWTAQTSGTTNDLRAVHFPVDATTGYAVGSNGTILKTTDGGDNWNSQSSGTIWDLWAVHFPVDATTGYAVVSNGTILKTTDGGDNWTTETTPTTEILRGLHFPVDTTTGYAVGYSGTILKTTSRWMATGSYPGNGTDGRPITGLGFAPNVVIIKEAGSAPAVCRTSTMFGDVSRRLDGGEAMEPDRIESLGADGFTIGQDAMVNRLGSIYHWVAFRQEPGKCKVGSYPGNDSDNQSITGVGFQPDYVVETNDSLGTQAQQRSSAMVGDISIPFRCSASMSDQIQVLEADGFQVGTALNLSGVTYHYVAFKEIPGQIKVGSYAGDSFNDDRNISGVGFRPQYLIIKANNSEAGAHRTKSLTGDSTLRFVGAANIANAIQVLQTDGFRVGTDPAVNETWTTNWWVAFANAATPTPRIIRWAEVDPFSR